MALSTLLKSFGHFNFPPEIMSLEIIMNLISLYAQLHEATILDLK